MTFDQIKTAIKDYCNLTSTEADTRIGKSVNRHYRRITSSIGMDASRFVTRTAIMTEGVRTVTFSDIEKIDRVIDVSDSTAIVLLTEVSVHELRSTQPGTGAPTKWALQNTDADSVTIITDTVPATGSSWDLQADGWTTLADLSGSDEPVFPESFHDVLVWFVLAEELLKKEKAQLAATYELKAKELLSDLRFHLADSHTRVTRQASGALPTGASGGSGGSNLGGSAYTQTGLITFDRDPSAPFAVTDGSAYVPNLYAEGVGNVTTDRLIGRDTAGTGESEQLTVGSGISFSGSGGIVLTDMAQSTIKGRARGAGTGAPTDLTGRQAGDIIDQANGVFNVKAYGATGDGSTDDTDAIQDAIDAAIAYNGGPGHGALDKAGTVVFPKGTYAVSHLDCTGCVGLEMVGTANWGVTLYASKQATSSKPVIDLTGSIGGRFRGIIVSAFTSAGATPATVAEVGWLVASSSSGNDSTAHTFENCGSEGPFSAAGLYVFGGTNHVFIDCVFSISTTDRPALFLGSNNAYTVASEFVTINAGTPTTGELTFHGCEIHGANNGAATNETTRIYGAYAIRFRDGVHDSSADRHVRFNGTCRNILFEGVQVYSESGTAATDFLYSDGATVNQLSLINLDFNDNGFDVGGGGLLIAGTGTVSILDVQGISATYVPATTLFSGTLTGPNYVPTGQLRFPSTQNASSNANTLDDYEEGDWTPVLTFSTPGDLSVTYSAQVGRYTKIGRRFTLVFRLITSAFTHTTASGALQITGSPFTGAVSIEHMGPLSFQGITKANYANFTTRMDGATATIDVIASGSAQTRTGVVVGDMPTGGSVQLYGVVEGFV